MHVVRGGKDVYMGCAQGYGCMGYAQRYRCTMECAQRYVHVFVEVRICIYGVREEVWAGRGVMGVYEVCAGIKM